jgi:hypothetical protein
VNVVEALDAHYARELGCRPDDMNCGRLVVAAGPVTQIRFGKGVPLALFSISKPHGAVISVNPGLRETLERAIDGAQSLDDAVCDRIEVELGPMIRQPDWFRGYRLYCEPSSFVDCRFGTIREVTDDDTACGLHAKWGGPVFGQIVDGRAVSWAAVKPLSDVVWDLSVQTLPEHCGRGYARSAVSSALVYIFEHGKLAGWGTDRTNSASLRIAQAVGFVDYGLDFGCVERGQT